MKKCKYSWQDIQAYHDEGHTWKEIVKKFGIAMGTIASASKRGDFRSRNQSEAGKLYRKNNSRPPMSAEVRAKISKSRIKYLEKNPSQVPYLLNHYSKGDSYPERYFEALFLKESIDLKKKLQIGLYQLDFYNKEKMIDLEIDRRTTLC